jgi:disulfide bond formation protein DsbB
MTTDATPRGDETTTPANPDIPAEPTFWNHLGFWFPHIVAVGYAFVILAAISTQFTGDEMPCPLCVLQRMGMILVGIAALWMVGQARKRTLTMGGYARSYGFMMLGALLGASISIRQVELHILPGDAGYGGTVLGLHLYTWALVTFIIVLIYTAIMLTFLRPTFPVVPQGDLAKWISWILIGIFIAVILANVVLIFAEEGFSWYLPDDPTGYRLLHPDLPG